MRDQQVQVTGAADVGLVMVAGDEEERRQRHRLPGHHEQVGVVCQQNDRHAREEHVVLQGDQRQPLGGFLAEETRRVERDPGGDRTEHQEEESREPVDPEVKRKIGQPERERHLRRLQPDRLQSESGKRKPGQRAERKRHAACEESVPGGKQAEQADGEPAGGDPEGARER